MKKKPAGILRLMGVAVGCIGLSLDDFCGFYHDEFESIFEAWHDMTETADRASWERMRLLAAITVSPHTKKTVTPRKLLPLPWDSPHGGNREKDEPALSAENRKRRFNDALRRLGESQGLSSSSLSGS